MAANINLWEGDLMDTKYKLNSILKGNNQKYSMVRLGFIIAVTGGMALCFLHPEQSSWGSAIIATAFGSKFFSKPFEGK